MILTGDINMIYKARLVKVNHLPKLMYNVTSVKPNKKYGYFEITTKIYQHQIITTQRFADVDYIELYDEKDPAKVVKVIHHE